MAGAELLAPAAPEENERLNPVYEDALTRINDGAIASRAGGYGELKVSLDEIDEETGRHKHMLMGEYALFTLGHLLTDKQINLKEYNALVDVVAAHQAQHEAARNRPLRLVEEVQAEHACTCGCQRCDVGSHCGVKSRGCNW